MCEARGAPSDPAVRRLRKLDCCAVSDALDILGLDGVVSGLAQLSGSGSIAGVAVTVKLVAVQNAAPPELGTPAMPPVHLGSRAVATSGSDNVLVIEQRTGVEAGSWGGVLSVGATVRKIAGVVADGPVRDIDEAAALRFPVFARGCTARTARGRIVEQATNAPVTIGDIMVNPGDYVIADRSAVIFISAARIGEVLTTAEAIAAKEACMTKKLLALTPIPEVMGAEYENMLRQTTHD